MNSRSRPTDFFWTSYLGYRVMNTNDQAGFRYDVNSFGPIVGLNFEF
jgi:hypothetical protein